VSRTRRNLALLAMPVVLIRLAYHDGKMATQSWQSYPDKQAVFLPRPPGTQRMWAEDLEDWLRLYVSSESGS
jgi:hypothetical protein